MATQHEDTKKGDLERVTTSRAMPDNSHHDGPAHGHSLGSVRLQNAETKDRILVPQPSSDPNDPLNWSKGFRYYQAVIVCLAMVMCNFLAAGPTVALEEIAIDFFGPKDENYEVHVAKVAYFFTSTSLLQGLGNLIWMPLIVKYGRRPVYLASFSLYTITAIWVGAAESYANALVARIVMGFAAGSGECIAPLTISDIFFLHERGTIMAAYTASLNFGVSIGIIASGLITIDLSYRYIYWIAAAVIGCLTIIVFFTMPETSYNRNWIRPSLEPPDTKSKTPKQPFSIQETHYHHYKPTTYLSSLKLHQDRPLTAEPISKLLLRPIILLVLPPVLWSTLIMSVTIGFLVAITSNFAKAFSEVYSFNAWQSGLCFIAGLLGSGFGIFFGGYFSDIVADIFTRRNNGIREPEFRLPAMTIGLVTTPLALALYGLGLQHAWHWTIPTTAMGLLNFSIAQATNVSLVYIVDSYRPIAGETVVTQLAFKSAFGFLLSFYTNPWIEKHGYQSSFGAMAGIAGCVLICWIPFFVWGKGIRHKSLQWPLVKKAVAWNEDREVGE